MPRKSGDTMSSKDSLEVVPKPPRCKPGPKPKSLSERKLTFRGPLKRKEKTHRREKKLRVLTFLEHHRVKVEKASFTTIHDNTTRPKRHSGSKKDKVPPPSEQTQDTRTIGVDVGLNPVSECKLPEKENATNLAHGCPVDAVS
ncbi:hypothetical protein BKA80DRAFT_261364 [Phyllosticta citrichinensis]